ncbi:hypothetical protein MMC20_006422 [Loxospora ochrophaea]|nr:hypothetical protein [Loxospora ochrophaea]
MEDRNQMQRRFDDDNPQYQDNVTARRTARGQEQSARSVMSDSSTVLSGSHSSNYKSEVESTASSENELPPERVKPQEVEEWINENIIEEEQNKPSSMNLNAIANELPTSTQTAAHQGYAKTVLRKPVALVHAASLDSSPQSDSTKHSTSSQKNVKTPTDQAPPSVIPRASSPAATESTILSSRESAIAIVPTQLNAQSRADARKLLKSRGFITSNPLLKRSQQNRGFFWAFRLELMHAMKYLLEKEVSVDVNENGCTALHYAVDSSKEHMAHFLLNENANVDATSSGSLDPIFVDVTPLHICARTNNASVARMLLTYGATLGSKCKDNAGNANLSVLHVAAQYGSNDVAKVCIEDHIQIDEKDRNGRSALYIASQNGHTNIVKTLLENGADVTIIRDVDPMVSQLGDTALHAASLFGHGGVVKLLLDANAQVDALNAKSETPLCLAGYGFGATDINGFLKRSHEFVAALLLEKGANLDNPGIQRMRAMIGANQKSDPFARFLDQVSRGYKPFMDIALPYGWEAKVHVDGQIYYADHVRKTVTWNDPRILPVLEKNKTRLGFSELDARREKPGRQELEGTTGEYQPIELEGSIGQLAASELEAPGSKPTPSELE